ncbi:transposase [Planotetraspora sp. GP83]|uniref:transposase n=1 Tax=Planotetraspora sp. GP83 TaxID=3156264 RepID=UPI0035158833
MHKWVGVNGYEVDVIVLDGCQVLRVRHLGYHIAFCGSVTEVARYVDLAELVEVADLPQQPTA